LTFRDRTEAGRKLAESLRGLASERPVVLALPRGGAPVGYEIASALSAPLDVLLVRKIGAPHHPELGLGAVVDGAHPQVVWNDDVLAAVDPPQAYLAEETQRQLREIERRRTMYLGSRRPVDLTGRVVIVVDDGIATGGTVRAALQGVRRAGAARVVLAVPVAPRETIDSLVSEADEIVCLETPYPFYSVGGQYWDFGQTSDQQVIELLRKAEAEQKSRSS
jgi:putative phosphoribosyl transferase